MQRKSIYGDQDPREMPAYSLAEAAHYLQIPLSTLRSWVKGRDYPTKTGRKRFQPLLTPPHTPAGQPLALSFFNMVEAHVLDALRRQHRLSMRKVREALTSVQKHFPSRHPLAEQRFVTDGLNLFIEAYGQLLNLTQDGQLAMKEVLQSYLSRIDYDPLGMPAKLYLFTRARRPDEPRVVVIDPYVSFGRPVLVGTGITTAAIAERYKAGESIEELAHDYELPPEAIQEAIRCELDLQLRAA
ncbi:MAG: hypothetical protein KatS3mg131_0277 [Candidatus Tectimicrobiota bacterium]|nr:MAG: hypothetical protein KatS3mg131_0277 [Candidatus Tectomicrobia bacterium]